MKKIILFITLFFSVNQMAFSQLDSIKIPKSLVLEIAKYVPSTQPKVQTITDALDLSQVRTAGMFAISIPVEYYGRQLLIQMQNSPYDEEYYNKGLRVNPVFYAEIQTNYAGEQIIVFKKK